MNGTVQQGTTRGTNRGTNPGTTRGTNPGTNRGADRDAGRGAGRRGEPVRPGRVPPPYGVEGNTALKLAVMEAAHLEELEAAPSLTPASPARRRARLRVAPPLPVAVPRAPFVILLLVLGIAGVLGVLMINTKINENAFRLGDLQEQRALLDQQEQQLAQRLAGFESPTSLAAAAKRLGLVPAGTPAFIELPNGRTLGVPAPATGTPSVTASGADQGGADGPAAGTQGSAG
jgi:hypothetical protein